MVDLNLTTIRLATDQDSHLPTFDYTKLTALNMCPRWGLVRYDQHKRMPGEGRSMALELGSAAHDGFAAVRLFQLLEYGPARYGDEVVPLAVRYARQLFGSKDDPERGTERVADFLRHFNSGEDTRQRVNACAISVINTSGFYDDPSDKRRTLSNLENSLVAYIDRVDIKDQVPYFDKVTGLIGIEVPVDLVIEFDDGTAIRFTGKMDGLEWHGDKLRVAENKTASRLDTSWQDSFTLNHQPTGYTVAATVISGVKVDEAYIRGMMVPLPKTYDLGGLVNMIVDRDEYRILEWLRWIYSTVTTQYLPYHQDPLNAPEYTHSCNRYFRSCSFIPLCAMAEPEERKLTFDQMVHDEWSPLHDNGTGD